MIKRGRLAGIIFRNNENYFTVAVFENDDEIEQFTAAGNMPEATEGLTYDLDGEWRHSRYGEEFHVRNLVEVKPDSREAIVNFLQSGVFKGVRKKTAENIVNIFGTKTLEIIENSPEKLTLVSGVGKKTAAVIAESYKAHNDFAKAALFFAEYGISSDLAMKMYAVYGKDTVEKIKENPYRLVNDLKGFGFRKADQIASLLGCDHDSEFRIESGIRFMLSDSAGRGSTCVPYSKFRSDCAAMLDVSHEMIDEAAQHLAIDRQTVLASVDGELVIYSYPYYKAETDVAGRLIALNDRKLQPLMSDIDGLILRSETDAGIKLSDSQISAVKAAVSDGVCVITGGPGTGKTTIINTIIDVLEGSGLDVALAAPTGRAAKRMSEASGRDAYTIHRLLEYTFSDGEDKMFFGRDHDNPIEQDVLIVDEMSMVDIMVMDALTDALPPDVRLIMVGDADQLPSVGAGRVLGDIIDSEVICTEKLTEIFRQAGESMIVVNAHRINQGEYPFLNEQDGDFFMIERRDEQSIVETIMSLCSSRLPSYYTDIDPVRDIQVLTPVRKGNVGIYSLNENLQQRLNPPDGYKSEHRFGNKTLRAGDKVMQIRNNYEREWRTLNSAKEGRGVFNGDIGFVTDIDEESAVVTIQFDNEKFAEYDFSDIDEIELAYAMTVHKSQGSEFPVVVMPVSSFPPMLANRNLLYTGVTRAKRGIVLVGSQIMLKNIIDNNRSDKRYTGLCSELKKTLKITGSF
ncbi:MAG: ATP-dependent RecD-like DNA helicase [Eubacteriales bacterium]|nr:ATP-dependent RecD-like DNA helicase [Eubacteriales bacterium]